MGVAPWEGYATYALYRLMGPIILTGSSGTGWDTGNRGPEVWPKVQHFEVALPCLVILTLEGHDGAERWPVLGLC